MKPSIQKILDQYIKDELVTSFEYNEQENSLFLSIDTIDKTHKVTVWLPETRKGKYLWSLLDEMKEVDANDLSDGIAKVLDYFIRRRDKFIEKYGGPNSEETITPITPSINKDDMFEVDSDDGEVVVVVDGKEDSSYLVSGSSDSLGISETEAKEYKQQILWDLEKATASGDQSCFGIYQKPTKSFVVRLALNTSYLSEWMAEALMVDLRRRIIIELEFEWNYLDALKPAQLTKDGIFQSKDKDLNVSKLNDMVKDFGVLKWYLSNRLGTAMRRNWIHKNSGGKKMKKQTTVVKEILSKEIQELMAIGFSKKQAYYALKLSNNEVNAAANLLMEGNNATLYESYPDPSTSDFSKTKKVDKKLMNFDNGPMFNQNVDFENELEDFFASGNIFTGILKYMNFKMANCSSNCVICDERLGYIGLKPTVCNRTLCMHSLEQYGLGIDVMGAILHNPEIVDLLVSLTYTACQMHISTNGVRELNPFPDSVEVDNLNFNKNGKNIQKILDVLDTIPHINTLASVSNGDIQKLKDYLNKKHKLAFPLLRWILASNRAHLSPVPSKKRIKELPKDVKQFILVSGAPEKERVFRAERAKLAAAKKGRGSFYAFHGSSVGNWHAILRIGLKNFSNTKMMSAGAAYGPGIYLASNMSTSMSYSAQGYDTWPNSNIGDMCCMAICEVLDKDTGIKKFDWGYVVQDETMVTTRYLLVYPPSRTSSYINLFANNLTLPEEMYT